MNLTALLEALVGQKNLMKKTDVCFCSVQLQIKGMFSLCLGFYFEKCSCPNNVHCVAQHAFLGSGCNVCFFTLHTHLTPDNWTVL